MAKKLAFDKVLFAVVMGLTALGLGMVYTASGPAAEAHGASHGMLLRQGLAAALGFGAMFVMMHVDYRVLRRRPVVYSLLGGTVVLLLVVLFSPTVNEARRWLFVGPFSFQPSELAKFVLIGYLAYQIDAKSERAAENQLVAAGLGATLLLAGLVQLEPDLGTAILIGGAGLMMLFLGGLRWRWIVGCALVAVLVVSMLVVAAPWRMERIEAFLDPSTDIVDTGYQPWQSLIAIGSGGVTGRGVGASVQRLSYLPLPYSDFIFAILAEELGLLGGVALLALLGVLLWRGVRAGLAAPDRFGSLLAFGITGVIVLQSLLNISVAVCLLPTTGIPLPFLSYGGSSLLVTLTASGVLLNVSQHG